jgi:quinol monooxygenase YgiN
MITLVNVLTVDAANLEPLIGLLRVNVEEVIRTLDGWISTELIVANDRTRVIIHSRWRDVEAVHAMRRDTRMLAYFPRIAALATFDSIVGTVVHGVAA